jgi:predicted metalloendopeptidase
MTPLLRHHVGSLSLGDPASVQHGLTGDQQFFINYAQSWRGKVR